MSKVKAVVEDAVVEEVAKTPQVKVDDFDQNKALEILVQAVKLAQKRGAYEIEETEVILKAIRKFVNPVV